MLALVSLRSLLIQHLPVISNTVIQHDIRSVKHWSHISAVNQECWMALDHVMWIRSAGWLWTMWCESGVLDGSGPRYVNQECWMALDHVMWIRSAGWLWTMLCDAAVSFVLFNRDLNEPQWIKWMTMMHSDTKSVNTQSEIIRTMWIPSLCVCPAATVSAVPVYSLHMVSTVQDNAGCNRRLASTSHLLSHTNISHSTHVH